MPLFVWANYATSLIQVLGTPVLAVTIILLVRGARVPPGYFRPGARRRPGAVPAPVLVLLASGGLHHGAAFDGCGQRSRSARFPASRFSATGSWPSRAWRSRCWDSWCGAITCSSAGSRCTPGMVFSFLSYFVAIPSAIKVFNWTATLYRGSISFQTPMLYAFGFIGLFTIGGLTGLFLAALGDGHPRDGYVLRGRALPLHHGGRSADGLPGRHAFLVAEDDGPHVSRGMGEAFGAGDFPGLQPHLLPAVHSGIPGDAAPLSCVPGRVPGAECAVDGRRERAGRGLPDPDDLLHLVAALRQDGSGEPVGRHRTGMENFFAASGSQFRRDADCDPRRVRLQHASWERRSKLADHSGHTETLELRVQFDTRGAAEGRVPARDVDLPDHGNHVLRRHVRLLYGVPQLVSGSVRVSVRAA